MAPLRTPAQLEEHIAEIDDQIKALLRDYHHNKRVPGARPAYLRRRGALYAQRKYYKHQLRVTELRTQIRQLQDEKERAKQTEQRLQDLVKQAQAAVDILDKCGTPESKNSTTIKQSNLLTEPLPSTMLTNLSLPFQQPTVVAPSALLTMAPVAVPMGRVPVLSLPTNQDLLLLTLLAQQQRQYTVCLQI